MFNLSGKVAIVTGASRGIGRDIAEVLAASGAHVVAGARADHAGATVEAIRHAGGKADLVTVDVTDTASIDAMVSGVVERHGRIDVLVNNAGMTSDQLLLRLRREAWDEVIATNLTSAFSCVKAVLQPMMKRRTGRIISISSVVGQMGNAGQANYAASKAGLIGFSKAMAREMASRNITVNVVAPGMIDTAMTRMLTEKQRQELLAQIPMERLGTPRDVAAAVCFLASDEAAYITGQVLAVNGGMYM